MNSSAIPESPGSVAGAPNLPEGFTGTFFSCGHHPPEEMLAALTAFLAPYRDGQARTHNAGPQAAAV